jgi:hypothetical protein
MPYGGEGIIRKTWKTENPTNNAHSNTAETIPEITEWKARWTNTPGSHEFTIQHNLKD